MSEDFERALRDLLHRDVPYAPAPADQWQRVRTLSRRGRRRRAASVTVCTLAFMLIAVGVAGVSGVGGGFGRHGSGGALGPAGQAPADGVSTPPGPTAPGSPQALKFDALDGLALIVPGDWNYVAESGGTPSMFAVITPQPLLPPAKQCPAAQFEACALVRPQLPEGDFVIYIGPVHSVSVSEPGEGSLLGGFTSPGPDSGCHAVQGTDDRVFLVQNPKGSSRAVLGIEVCGRDLSAATKNLIADVVASAHLHG